MKYRVHYSAYCTLKGRGFEYYALINHVFWHESRDSNIELIKAGTAATLEHGRHAEAYRRAEQVTIEVQLSRICVPYKIRQRGRMIRL